MAVTLSKGGGATPSGEGAWDASGNIELEVGGTTTFQINDLGQEDWELAGVLGVTLTGDLAVPGGDIDAGASGTAGSVDIFPSTASKGKVSYTAADQAGNTTLTIVNAAMGSAYTYTYPDAGGNAEFVMNAGAQTVAGVKTFSGANVHNGADTFNAALLSTPGAAAAAVAMRLGASATEGWEIKVIDETLASLAAVSTDLTEDIPDGAVLLSSQGNIETLCVAGGTSVKVGIGPVADPDKYGISADLLKNTKIDLIPDWAVLSGAEDVQVNACATAGGIGDTAFSAGAVRVRIVYAVPNSLDDAA